MKKEIEIIEANNNDEFYIIHKILAKYQELISLVAFLKRNNSSLRLKTTTTWFYFNDGDKQWRTLLNTYNHCSAKTFYQFIGYDVALNKKLIKKQ